MQGNHPLVVSFPHGRVPIIISRTNALPNGVMKGEWVYTGGDNQVVFPRFVPIAVHESFTVHMVNCYPIYVAFAKKVISIYQMSKDIN